MNLEKIHLIKSKDMCLSYYYPTADIRVINKETYDILSALKEYKDIHEALELYRDEEQVVSLIRSIYASNKGEHSNNQKGALFPEFPHRNCTPLFFRLWQPFLF